jgi:hypothetical protein
MLADESMWIKTDGDVSVNFQSMVQNGEWNQWSVRLPRRFAGKAEFASWAARRDQRWRDGVLIQICD